MGAPSPSTDPAALVRRLRVALATGSLPPDVSNWLADGLDAWLADEAPTLCAALGLRGPGRTGRVQQSLRLQERDAALAAAHATLPSVDALAAAVRRFERTWPRVAHLDEPPPKLSDTERELFAAFRRGAPPTSRRGLALAVARGCRKTPAV
jgi:hypothetical protein